MIPPDKRRREIILPMSPLCVDGLKSPIFFPGRAFIAALRWRV
jgi:hypothetical protein